MASDDSSPVASRNFASGPLRWFVLAALVCCAGLAVFDLMRWLRPSDTAWLDEALESAGGPGPPGSQVSYSANAALQPEIAALIEEANRVAEQLVSSFPDDPGPLSVWAQQRYQFGDVAEAIGIWKKCLDQNPGCVEAYLGIGSALLERGDYARAEKALRHTLMLDPSSPQAPLFLANALFSQGKMRETVEVLEPSVRAHPGSMPGFLLLGQARLQLHDYAKAKQSFQSAAKLVPDFPNAHYGLATACDQLGQTNEAAQHRQRFKELDADELRKRRASDPRLRDSASVRGKVAGTYRAAARIYLARGDASTAEELQRKADEVASGSP